MAILVLGFVVVVVLVLLAWAHFSPTGVAAVTAKLPPTVQAVAVDAAVLASNAAERVAADAIKAELALMRKWFSAAAGPHIDALEAENETYRTEVKP